MAKKTNPKLIGGFVVGAVALVIVGVLAFGGGQFLKAKEKGVIFFEGSLSGLDVGSPVTFRGIKVGTVSGIVIKYDVTKQELHIPVYIDIQPEKFEIVAGERNERNISALVKRGLRGKLEVQSLVTGQAVINFDFYPDVPLKLVGTEPGMIELPSAPSDIDILKANLTSLVAKLSKLPLDEVASDLIGVLKSAEHTLTTADQTLETIQGQVQPLADNLKGVTDRASKLLDNVDADLPQLVTGLNQLMRTASNTLNQAEQTLRTAQNALVPTSPLYFEVTSTLGELKVAATSVRSLADFLERNPNSLITGKK